MDIPGPRLPVEVVERIIDAAALLPSYDTHLTPKQVHSRYKTLRSCTLLCTQLHPRSKLHLFQTIILARNGGFTRLNRLLLVLSNYPHLPALVNTVIVFDKAVRHDSQSKLTRNDATRRAILDEARDLVGRWPGLEDLQPSREGYYAGPESTLLDAFLGQMVRFLPVLRTFRTHVLPTSFDFDANPFQAIPWRRNLDALPTHTIVVLELVSVIFRSSRDFIVMLQALRLLRVLRCTQVAWGIHEWQSEWLSLPHSLALMELELKMSDWLLDLPALERNAWAGGIVTALRASMSSLEKLTLDEGALQFLCGSIAQATKSPPEDKFAMTALHTIHLDLDCQYHAVSNIPFLFSGRLGPTRHLRTLVIDFDPNAVSSVRQAAVALPSFSSRLEDALCRPTYDALECVVLPLPGRTLRRGRARAAKERAVWQQLVRDYFPMLHERGVLRC